ncbi:sensor histidine kinase [Parvularcula flava]|uniref:ATPase n=1 Tax=Aquisalinus luteolus TaxID=1566827 RepID=A0A8J3EVZ4_9PROT|nr:histidine kinase [Aquisalinus luteolus]NHK29660.1 sensor histidine kinase [Aquisalinus luteolus]GGI02184.1 ATPase [Aquisalinus luteolus]
MAQAGIDKIADKNDRRKYRPGWWLWLNSSPYEADGSPVLPFASHELTRAGLAWRVFLIWTVIGVLVALPNAMLEPLWVIVPAKVLEAWSWALFTPLLLYIDIYLSRKGIEGYRYILTFALLSVPICLAEVVVSGIMLYPIEAVIWNPLRDPEFTVHFFVGGWFTYCAIVGIILAVRYYRNFVTSRFELERMERRLLESHLNTLRLQLEPHFLFNALNAVSSEIGNSPVVARNMVSNLAELLRHSLAFKDSTRITLAQELALLDHYLAIQRIRFGDRIDISIDVDPDTLSAVVPCMLLQPLVENAIRHGIEKRLSGGAITITAHTTPDGIQISILDDGVGLHPGWRMEKQTGLGIRLSRERLAGFYNLPAEQMFSMSNRPDGGTIVVINIPHQEKVEDESRHVAE